MDRSNTSSSAFPRTISRAPALEQLIESKTVRILDLVFIAKDADGSVVVLEFDQLAEREAEALDALNAEIGGVLGPEDIEHAASFLEPNSSAALLIWEDLWAAPFAAAVREAGGALLEGARIPHELVPDIENLPSAE